jgi:HSP20 family protein
LIKREFSTKSFKRTFSLDDKINSQAIEAVMENGILNLHLPLKEENLEPKKIISIK